MRILLATPYLSQHFDSGLYWAGAFSRMGHHVQLWDYRREILPPNEGLDCDVFVGMKTGPEHSARVLGDVPKVVYWPDGFHRTPGLLRPLADAYDHKFTMANPYPEGWTFLPGAWDPVIHQEPGDLFHSEFHGDRPDNKLMYGTYTPWKEEVCEAVQPDVLFGNGWNREKWYIAELATYQDELVSQLQRVKLIINAHRDRHTGVGRRLFESIACAPTLTDRVPGLVEIFGLELAQVMSYATVQEAKTKAEVLVANDADRHALWMRQHAAIVPYTYDALAWKVLLAAVPDLVKTSLPAA